jgi:hypothetical protein
MNTKNPRYKPSRHARLHASVPLVLLVLAGFFYLGHNLGLIPPSLFEALHGWPTLLVLAGSWALLAGHPVCGILCAGAGVLFLYPRLAGAGQEWIDTYWPVGLILAGVVLLVKVACHPCRACQPKWEETPRHHGEGYITSENRFGATRHVVLAPVFEGASIRDRFGATTLDLRRTTLAAPRTCIDIDCSFGSIEILAPATWVITTSELHASAGEVRDKRLHAAEMDTGHVLIIRGRVSFAGVEIKE